MLRIAWLQDQDRYFPGILNSNAVTGAPHVYTDIPLPGIESPRRERKHKRRRKQRMQKLLRVKSERRQVYGGHTCAGLVIAASCLTVCGCVCVCVWVCVHLSCRYQRKAETFRGLRPLSAASSVRVAPAAIGEVDEDGMPSMLLLGDIEEGLGSPERKKLHRHRSRRDSMSPVHAASGPSGGGDRRYVVERPVLPEIGKRQTFGSHRYM